MVGDGTHETVDEVFHVWTPRFLRAGILMEDINEVARRTRTSEDWAAAWIQLAEEHEALAERWLEKG